MAKTDAERLADLQAKMAQLQARAEAIQARQRAAQRKVETRRKVILGGLLLDRAQRDPRMAAFVAKLVGELTRAQDRKAFEGWQPPGAGDGPPRGQKDEGGGRGW